MLRLVGMDWATEPDKRALVALDVETDFATCCVVSVQDRISDSVAVAACSNRDLAVVAIDTPFGWPREFSQFVSTWRASTGTQAPPNSDKFRFRLKDLPDVALLAQVGPLDAGRLRAALKATFDFRKTQQLPSTLPAPPSSWQPVYARMAGEDERPWRTLPEVFDAVRRFIDPVLAGGTGTWDPTRWSW